MLNSNTLVVLFWDKSHQEEFSPLWSTC